MIFDLPDDVLKEDPSIHDSVFIAPGAQVLGRVQLGEEASVWYNSVLRGDINKIVIGARTNIQDGCILHMENDVPCVVENDVTVGHHVNLHACYIEECCLIGIGAIVLSGAHIGKGSVIGAGSLILENQKIPSFSMVVGSPGRIIRQNPETILDKQRLWAQKYVNLAKVHKEKYGSQ